MVDLDITDVDGGCHCGSVRFHARLTDGLHTARRCTCSYCRMRGAVAVSVDLPDFSITRGESALTLYQFNTKAARHYFCSVCGIYTHHQRRSSPHQFGVNLACLDGYSPFDLERVTVLDGVTHPLDRPAGRSEVAGVLIFQPAVDQADD